MLFIIFAGVLQTITTPYFCIVGNLEILKPSRNFKDLYDLCFEKKVLFPMLSSDVLRFLYLFLQPSLEAAGCTWISELMVPMVAMSSTMTVKLFFFQYLPVVLLFLPD